MIHTSDFVAVSANHIQYFKQVVGEPFVKTNATDTHAYSHDETEDLHFQPEVVVIPKATREVSAILAYCNDHKIPVTPRGAGTGLSGGALPVFGGVVLSMERFNKIIHIDEQNLQVTTEPGVITQVLQETVAEKGLFYPPDPSSRGSCFIGGNLAESAGGPKAVKYGVTKDYVLNLEVVLANGEVIWTGANVLKNATGYNLTQLMVGSEGTLGVITKVVLRLIPLPRHTLVLLVPFNSAEQACAAVAKVFQAGFNPSALEFMERDALEWTLRYKPEISLTIPDHVQAHLLIEVDGNNLETMQHECEQLALLMEEMGAGEILFAESEAEKNALWKLRRSVGEAVKSNSVYKEEDTVVPRYHLPELLNGVKQIGKKYGFHSVCYGHAGDGNLHVNIIRGNLSQTAWEQDLPKGIREIFELCIRLGGTLSGEHGIGYVQKEYMPIAFNQTQLALMQGIKHIFDPKGILNPGKIFPSSM